MPSQSWYDGNENSNGGLNGSVERWDWTLHSSMKAKKERMLTDTKGHSSRSGL